MLCFQKFNSKFINFSHDYLNFSNDFSYIMFLIALLYKWVVLNSIKYFTALEEIGGCSVHLSEQNLFNPSRLICSQDILKIQTKLFCFFLCIRHKHRLVIEKETSDKKIMLFSIDMIRISIRSFMSLNYTIIYVKRQFRMYLSLHSHQ